MIEDYTGVKWWQLFVWHVAEEVGHNKKVVHGNVFKILATVVLLTSVALKSMGH